MALVLSSDIGDSEMPTSVVEANVLVGAMENADESEVLGHEEGVGEVSINEKHFYGGLAFIVALSTGSLGLGNLINSEPWFTVFAWSWTVSTYILFPIFTLAWLVAEVRVRKEKKQKKG